MPRCRNNTPAVLWRAFFVSAVACTALPLRGAPAPRPPDLAQVGLPSQEEAAKLLRQVREAGLPGEYFLRFELRSLPRRGEGRTFHGQLWSGDGPEGEVVRVELVDAAGETHRFLFQRGAQSRVWRLANGRAVPVEGDALLAPLVPGIEVSAFDLQMPFLFWPEASVERIARVLGRPTNAFLFRPPEAFAKSHPEIYGVRAYLDTQFNAILQTEVLGPNRRPVKTFSFLSLKRVGEQPVPKEMDFRNEVSRDKTRLHVTGVALNLDLPDDVFAPASLARPAAPPPAAQLVRLDP